MKLLVIEDELEINESICRFFKSEGFLVENAICYQDALFKIEDFDYDCIILDLSLPDGDGLELIKEIKKQESKPCIIVVSARDSLDDKVMGLELGADDYLSKPFSMVELNARIKSVIRRSHFSGDNMVQFNELRIAPDSRQFFVHETEIQLTPKEFDLICYFVMNKNRILTKENIAEHLWGDFMGISANSFDFIYTHIRNLRHKIVEAGGKEYIQSVYSIGYKFVDA